MDLAKLHDDALDYENDIEMDVEMLREVRRRMYSKRDCWILEEIMPALNALVRDIDTYRTWVMKQRDELKLEAEKVVLLTEKEAEELERFRKRRQHFGSDLEIANIHNLPSDYPEMYKRVFGTDSTENSLFGRPWYSDKKDDVIKLYETALSEGYTVAQN